MSLNTKLRINVEFLLEALLTRVFWIVIFSRTLPCTELFSILPLTIVVLVRFTNTPRSVAMLVLFSCPAEILAKETEEFSMFDKFTSDEIRVELKNEEFSA